MVLTRLLFCCSLFLNKLKLKKNSSWRGEIFGFKDKQKWYNGNVTEPPLFGSLCSICQNTTWEQKAVCHSSWCDNSGVVEPSHWQRLVLLREWSLSCLLVLGQQGGGRGGGEGEGSALRDGVSTFPANGKRVERTLECRGLLRSGTAGASAAGAAEDEDLASRGRLKRATSTCWHL